MNGQQIVMAASDEKKHRQIKQEFITAINRNNISHFDNNRKKSNTAFKKEDGMPDIAEAMEINRNKPINLSHNANTSNNKLTSNFQGPPKISNYG
jgi:hypothetical protein